MINQYNMFEIHLVMWTHSRQEEAWSYWALLQRVCKLQPKESTLLSAGWCWMGKLELTFTYRHSMGADLGETGGTCPSTFWSGGDANTFVPSTFCDLKLKGEVTEKATCRLWKMPSIMKILVLGKLGPILPTFTSQITKIFVRSAHFQSHWCTYYQKGLKHVHIFHGPVWLGRLFLCKCRKWWLWKPGAQHSIM